MAKQKWSAPVLTVDDLSKAHPFFESRMGKGIGKGLLRLFKVSQLNSIHSDHSYLSGVSATSAILDDPRIEVTYTVHGEEYLQPLREGDPFFTVSNHPYGGLDGLILLDIMGRVREDYMVLVNGILNQISILKDFWIPVTPLKSNVEHDPTKNISGLQMVRDRIMGGHPVGLFPAGGLPHYDSTVGQPMEIPWKLNCIRIMKLAGIPVVPIMFEGNNSKRYFRFGERWGYDVASILIPKELLNKRGSNIEVYVGEPILPHQFSDLPTLVETRDYMMKRALSILPSYQGKL